MLLQMMKRKIIFCLTETADISSDSDTSLTSNISEFSNSSMEDSWTDEEDILFFSSNKIFNFCEKRKDYKLLCNCKILDRFRIQGTLAIIKKNSLSIN